MKTRNIFTILILGVLFLSTNAWAGDNKVSKALFVSTTSEKIKVALNEKLVLTDDMDRTKARVFYKINEDGKVTFGRLQYADREKAKELEEILKTIPIDNMPLKPGAYYVDIHFVVY